MSLNRYIKKIMVITARAIKEIAEFYATAITFFLLCPVILAALIKKKLQEILREVA